MKNIVESIKAFFGIVVLCLVAFSFYQLWDLYTWDTRIDGKPTREQFAQSISMQKTSLLIEKYGKPEHTYPSYSGGDNWVYRKTTYDPVSGKVDFETTVSVIGDTVYETRP